MIDILFTSQNYRNTVHVINCSDAIMSVSLDLVHGDQPVRPGRVRAGHGLPRVRPHRLPG